MSSVCVDYMLLSVPDKYNQTTALDLATLAYYAVRTIRILEITREPAVTTMEGTPVEETFYIESTCKWDYSRDILM